MLSWILYTKQQSMSVNTSLSWSVFTYTVFALLDSPSLLKNNTGAKTDSFSNKLWSTCRAWVGAQGKWKDNRSRSPSLQKVLSDKIQGNAWHILFHSFFPLHFDATSEPKASSIWLGKSKKHIFPSIPKCTARSPVT